jgi:glycosyltransferase involved in cell wall biosynthesis
MDDARLRFDPWLRSSYMRAELVLGVAPYVGKRLSNVPLKAYSDLLELGIDSLAPATVKPCRPGEPVRLLHVGRGVRNKGLRDVIRAMGLLKDEVNLTLTCAGEGEDIARCKEEAERLGVSDKVTFLGLLPRAEVEKLYAFADIFVFPSFREPAGNVLYEAMRWGLPVITAARGGPDSIVDDTTGIRIPVTDPERYAADIASAIGLLAHDVSLRARMGAAARAKLEREGLWTSKADRLVQHYHCCLARL